MLMRKLRRPVRHYGPRIVSHLRSHWRRMLPVPPRPRSNPAAGSDAPHWVVCFYGVDRSLKYTLYGIMQHVFKPLQAANVRVTVVTHFNRIERNADAHSGETRVDFSHDNARHLNSDILWMEPQRDASIAADLQTLESLPWISGMAIHDNSKWNLCHQLHSLDRVHDLIHMAGLQDADVFAVLRADLQYLDDLNVADIQQQILSGSADLITPNWMKWSGLNDRFCFLSRDGLTPVLTRRRVLDAYRDASNSIEAEHLLAFTAARAGLKLGYTPMRAERVRGNGRVRHEDFRSG